MPYACWSCDKKWGTRELRVEHGKKVGHQSVPPSLRPKCEYCGRKIHVKTYKRHVGAHAVRGDPILYPNSIESLEARQERLKAKVKAKAISAPLEKSPAKRGHELETVLISLLAKKQRIESAIELIEQELEEFKRKDGLPPGQRTGG